MIDVLLHTSLEKPRSSGNLVNRPRLIDELNKALDKRLIMVLAPAGYGKTSLLIEWLDTCGLPSGWLSLDADHNNFENFLAYFIAAIQTVDAHVGKNVLSVLRGPHLPPLSKLSMLLVNELAHLPKDTIIVLEDYHLIRNRHVHELITSLVIHLPRHVHLVIATRTDPPFPMTQWRAHGYLGELRSINLRFTHEETQALLAKEFGTVPPSKVVDELVSYTEGWVTGLKLAAISIRDRVEHMGSPGQIESATAELKKANENPHIADYLMEDVFSRQPRAVRDFLMRTSILNQFSESLCDALDVDVNSDKADKTDAGDSTQAGAALKWIKRANLFIVPQDSEGRWYRYHHLFRELLSNRLRKKYDASAIDQLHLRAGEWLAKEGFAEDAIRHFLIAEQPDRAAALIEDNRHTLLNDDNWRTLERWLNLLPDDVIQSRPELLASRAWVNFFRINSSAIVVALQSALQLLPALDNRDPKTSALRGELAVHQSHAALFGCRFNEALELAKTALELIPKEQAYVLGTAATVLLLSAQAAGESVEHMHQMEQLLLDDAGVQSATVTRILGTFAWMACYAGEWEKARGLAEYVLKLVESRENRLIFGWGHLYLGWYYYQQNELDEAAQHFDAVVQNSYNGVHWRCAISSMAGLGMTYQAQGKTDQAEEIAQLLDEYALDARSQEPMSESQSFRAHLAILQNKTALALEWAQSRVYQHVKRPFFWTEAPAITRIHAFIAEGSAKSLARAAELLPPALELAQSSQNIWREVEILALQALLLCGQGNQKEALNTLELALGIARPGHFVRSFVDLGPKLRDMLAALIHDHRQADYASELLAAFDHPDRKPQRIENKANSQLIEPLTAREMEILIMLCQYLSNDEIARALFISPVTVKSHIRNLFEKLGVNRRRFAIMRAKELGLVPSA